MHVPLNVKLLYSSFLVTFGVPSHCRCPQIFVSSGLFLILDTAKGLRVPDLINNVETWDVPAHQ